MPLKKSRTESSMLAVFAIVATALFFEDNAEFVERANENWADGMTWHYTGVQKPDGNPAITFKREDGTDFIIFKMKN